MIIVLLAIAWFLPIFPSTEEYQDKLPITCDKYEPDTIEFVTCNQELFATRTIFVSGQSLYNRNRYNNMGISDPCGGHLCPGQGILIDCPPSNEFKKGKCVVQEKYKTKYSKLDDIDQDGVLNTQDLCPTNTVGWYIVEKNGCLNFESAIYMLSHEYYFEDAFKDFKYLGLKNLQEPRYHNYVDELESIEVKPKNIEELQIIIDKVNKTQ